MTKQRHGRLTIFQAAAVDDERLGNAAFRVLAALGTYSDEQGWCVPTQHTLATRLRITRQAVSKSLRELEASGYITIHHQHGEDGAQIGSKYRLCLDILTETPPQPDVAGGGNVRLRGGQPDVAGVNTALGNGKREVDPRNLTLPPPQPDVAHKVNVNSKELTIGATKGGVGGKRAPRESPPVQDADSFAPTSLDLAWAAREYPDVDLPLQTEMFLDHARATARIIADWSAAWKNWIRKAPQFSPRSPAHRTQAEHNSARRGRLVT